MIGLFVLNIWPVFKTMYLSFTTTEGFNNTRWVGNANYVKLIGDTAVWQSTWNTILFTLIVVPVGVFLSLVVAALLNSKIKGKGIYRTIYFLPMVVAPAAVALLWKWLFNADYGLINYTLSVFGINGIQWLTDPKYALLSVCIVGIWSTLGYNMVILLAGLQNIPGTYYEAADIDGAGAVQKFFFITVPMVSPTLFFVVITQIMAALKQFDLVYMMADETNPALESVRTILYLFYENAFVVNDKGYASAIVVLAFLIIMVVTAIQFWLQKKWVHYE
jgi:multiple sugar transport system permease protein